MAFFWERFFGLGTYFLEFGCSRFGRKCQKVSYCIKQKIEMTALIFECIGIDKRHWLFLMLFKSNFQRRWLSFYAGIDCLNENRDYSSEFSATCHFEKFFHSHSVVACFDFVAIQLIDAL